MVSRFNNIIHLQKVNKKLLIFLTLLLTLSLWLRLYNLDKLMYWMFDEERDAFIIKKILVDKHLTLIGGSIPGGFYLAPGYFYISSVFYFFSSLNPRGPAIVASLLGSLSSIGLFFVVKKLFDKKVAVMSSLIYTFSYLVIIYNRTWWPLTFAPLVSISTYFFLYQIVKNKDLRWSILLSAALILGAQSDPSNFSLILLTILVWIIYKLPVRKRSVLFSIFLFLFSHLSLVIFDIRHNFLNLRHLVNFLSLNSTTGNFSFVDSFKGLITLPQTFARFIFISLSPDMSLQIVPDQYYVNLKMSAINPFLMMFSVATLITFFILCLRNLKSRKHLGLFIVGLHFILTVLGVVIYNILFPGYTHEWFFQVLFPLFSIMTALIIASLLKTKFIAPAAFFLLFIYAISGVITILNAKNSYNFQDKSDAVKWSISNVGQDEFSLDSIGKNFSYGGYRYLFYLYGKEPIKSYMDPVFIDWMYPASSIPKEHPSLVVAIMNPDFFYDRIYQQRYHAYLKRTISRKQFGRIEVLIVDNSDKWVDW